MKKLYILTLAFSLFNAGLLQAQNELYNNGALIYVNGQAGTIKAYNVLDMPSLYVKGEIVNNTGNFENAVGEIQITGDFTNNGTFTSTGDEVFLNTTVDQSVKGVMNGVGANNNFQNLFVLKSGRFLNIETNTNVANYVDIDAGIIRTDNVSHADDGAAYPNEFFIMNAVPTEFVSATTGTIRYVEGRLRRATTAGNSYTFPIGGAASSNDGIEPATITVNTGSNSILGYIHPATYNYTDMIFQDIGTDPAAGFSAYAFCVPGAGGDGILDALPLSNDFPEEWVFSSTGLNYDITVQPGPILDATTLYTSVCGGTWKYLLKNGIPGGDGYAIVAGPAVPTGYGTFLSAFNGVNLAPTGNTLTGQTSFSSFRLHGPSSIGGALPVTLISLTATAINNNFIRVNWATATEVNNKGFEVLRSTDGISFTKVGWLAAHVDGNSTTDQYYSFDDKEVVANKMYYYKLGQTDKDGQIHLTKVVSASLTGNGEAFTIGDFFPNPSNYVSSVLISSTQEMDINVALYNSLSQIVSTQNVHINIGENTIELGLNRLADGIYHGIFETSSGNISRKIIVAK